jgi:glycerol kinase
MQFQSDILMSDVVRPGITETTALGAAYLAGLASGYWSSIDSIREQWQIERRFFPSMDPEARERLLIGWNRAVNAAITWSDDREGNK